MRAKIDCSMKAIDIEVETSMSMMKAYSSTYVICLDLETAKGAYLQGLFGSSKNLPMLEYTHALIAYGVITTDNKIDKITIIMSLYVIHLTLLEHSQQNA